MIARRTLFPSTGRVLVRGWVIIKLSPIPVTFDGSHIALFKDDDYGMGFIMFHGESLLKPTALNRSERKY